MLQNDFIKSLAIDVNSFSKEIQAIIVYKCIIDDFDSVRYSFGFRPKKEYKHLLKLAEQFQHDRNLEHACIPLEYESFSDLSTTKEFPLTKEIAKMIDKHSKLESFLQKTFTELGCYLPLAVSNSKNNFFVANVYKVV